MAMRGHKLRIYPNDGQRRLLACCFGVGRWSWNVGLEMVQRAYDDRGVNAAVNLAAEGKRILEGIEESGPKGPKSAWIPGSGPRGNPGLVKGTESRIARSSNARRGRAR